MARAGTRPDRGLHHRCRDPSWPSHPVVIYRLSHGPNEEVLQRDPAALEAFSTNITRLAMPIYLAIDEEASTPCRTDFSDAEQAVGKEWTPLGLAATIGFAWLMLVALVALVRATRGPPTEAASNFDDARQRHLSMLALTAMALRDHRRDLVHHRLDHFPGSPQLGAWRPSSRCSPWSGSASSSTVLARRSVNGGASPHLHWRLPSASSSSCASSIRQAAGWFPLAHSRREWRLDQRLVDQIERQLPPPAVCWFPPSVHFPRATRATGALRGLSPLTRPALVLRLDAWETRRLAGSTSTRPLSELVLAISAVGFEGFWLDRVIAEGRSKAAG